MKKVLVAGAALLLAGSMVSAASAEVNLSGDARVRYVGMANANWSNDLTEQSDYQDRWDSRIRIKFNAKAKGGAFIKARLRLTDMVWDGQGWGAWSSPKNTWTDYAFLGIPIGPVTITGGLQKSDFSKFFEWDARPTRFKVDYNAGAVRVIGLYDMEAEITGQDWDDNDITAWGLIGSFSINDDMTLKAYFRYQDDQRENIGDDADSSGFSGSVNFEGKFGMIGAEAEIAYREADVQQQYNVYGDFIDDDGLGMYGQVSFDMGAFTPAVQLGYSQNGFLANENFGFIMIGAAEPITVIDLGTEGGDTLWAAFTTGFQVSEQLKLSGNLVYYDIDLNEDMLGRDVRGLMDMWELSGSITYTVSEGADISYKIGYLDMSYDGRLNAAGISEDGIFGNYVRFKVDF